MSKEQEEEKKTRKLWKPGNDEQNDNNKRKTGIPKKKHTCR